MLTPESTENSINVKTTLSSKLNLNPLEIMEADFITELIQKYKGNRKQIASEMNISERTLYRKLKRLKLNDLTVV